MNPTRTAPEMLSSLTTGWNEAALKWWDQSLSALDPWKQAWDIWSPGITAPTLGMPSRGHRARGSSSPCGCDTDRECRCDGCRDCRCGDGHGHGHEHALEHEHEHGHGHGDGHGHEHGHGHEPPHAHDDTSCGCDSPCHCCIADADVVLHARAGEQRVIPFLLRNPWRREREVTVAVGPWQVYDGGRLEVRSVLDTGESLTLQPCEKRVVRLVVLVRGRCDDEQDPTGHNTDTSTVGNSGDKRSLGKTTKATAAKPAVAGDAGTLLTSTDGKRFGCDVESCASAYADVRFEGCARPQRVAVVVHPASCDAIDLPCDCGCCC